MRLRYDESEILLPSKRIFLSFEKALKDPEFKYLAYSLGNGLSAKELNISIVSSSAP